MPLTTTTDNKKQILEVYISLNRFNDGLCANINARTVVTSNKLKYWFQ